MRKQNINKKIPKTEWGTCQKLNCHHIKVKIFCFPISKSYSKTGQPPNFNLGQLNMYKVCCRNYLISYTGTPSLTRFLCLKKQFLQNFWGVFVKKTRQIEFYRGFWFEKTALDRILRYKRTARSSACIIYSNIISCHVNNGVKSLEGNF